MEKISENGLSLKRSVGLQIAQAVKEGHLPLSIKLKFLPVRPGNYAPRNLCDSDGGAGMCASGGRAAELTGPAKGRGPRACAHAGAFMSWHRTGPKTEREGSKPR